MVYIHGETTAVPLKFKSSNLPYWNAGAVFGYLVLAGHGTGMDCSSEGLFLDAVLGPIGTSRPELPVEWPFPTPHCPPTNSTYNSVRNVDIVNFGAIRVRNFRHSSLINPILPPTLGNGATCGPRTRWSLLKHPAMAGTLGRHFRPAVQCKLALLILPISAVQVFSTLRFFS